MPERILLSPPGVTDAEEQALVRAFRTGWIVPLGPEVDAFERELAEFCGRRHAVALLVVCTGNICRSPVGEAVLQSLLPEDVRVSSAGTHAVVGAPAEPEAQNFLRRKMGLESCHAARQLTREQAESADLVIGMATEHRSWIARNAPRTVRRTFTLKELSLLLEALPSTSRFTSLKDLGLAAAQLRHRLAVESGNLDIPEPFRGPPEDYESSFGQVLESSRRMAGSLTHRLQIA